MNNLKIVKWILIAFVVTTISCCIYTLNDVTTKSSNWETKEITGQIRELKLITTFPDEGLLICFIDGNFTFIDINYYWTYSHLLPINSNNSVKLTFATNGAGQTKVISIQELPYE